MVVPMMRPDVFGALASHAGDALFEACYLPDFPRIARKLRDSFEGSFDVFFERLAAADHLDFNTWVPRLEAYGYAAAYSPDPEHPGKALLPFDIATGRLIDDVWAQWLDKDPVRMAPAYADALRSMRRHLPRRRQAATSTSSTSARRRSRPSWRRSACRTRSSCSRASTAGSRTATRARSGSSCWRSRRDRAVALQAPRLDRGPRPVARSRG